MIMSETLIVLIHLSEHSTLDRKSITPNSPEIYEQKNFYSHHNIFKIKI